MYVQVQPQESVAPEEDSLQYAIEKLNESEQDVANLQETVSELERERDKAKDAIASREDAYGN